MKEISRDMTLRNTISRSVKYGLSFVGIWPGTPFPALYKVCWFTSLVTVQFHQYSYMAKHFKTDGFVKLIDCLSVSLPYSLLIVKFIVTWINHSALREMISTMEEDCVKYAVLDTNNLISKTADFSFRLTSTISFLYLFAPSMYAAASFAIPRSNDSVDRQLLVNMDLPFDTNQSPTYELVVAIQVVFQTMASYAFGIFSALLMMVVLHIGCHIDILCNVLANISSRDKGLLRFVTLRHQEIIVFVQRIEKLFTYISLFQLISNTLLTCCAGFLAITSQMIIDAAYQMAWYNLQPTLSRQMILLILRSQKGLPLTFGKFSPLSLESFAKIMKASASYMSVLLAMS
ncbi:odorant receptor 10-like isoform X2 [Nomia melanderi]|uniref:odorant receptor 10-like isoform X2 n=1 Tax=Nomia melanderi TaxID=2448451 RepID=UPI003FCE6384